MSSGAYGSGGQKGVSAGRKAFSTILLLVLLVILAIELRAGLGVSLSEKALQEYSKDGIINGLTLAEAQSKMKLFPESAVDDSQPNETTIRYTWFSLLRPLIGKPQAVLHIVATRGDNPMAMSYHGELTEEDISALNPKSDPNAAPGALPKNGPVGAGMGGGGGGMGPPGGMSRSRDPREEGRSRPEVEGEGEPAGEPAGEGAAPAGGEQPAAEGTTPAEGAAPAEGTAPAEGAAPAGEEKPAEEKPADSAPAAGGEQPAAPAAGENGQP